MPNIFDESKSEWASERAQLRTLLSEAEWNQARRTTLNAHYTDPAYAKEIWAALERLGFDGGEVLEPGSGAGTFMGLAPQNTHITGVELDSVTAQIAQALYPDATVRNESFADTRFPKGHFDAAIGNVPFGKMSLFDPTHNVGNHSIHNHFILKSLALTRPGGMVAVLTSHFTMDSRSPAARQEMNNMADLVGAVRLPSGAHRRSAGTEALTDLLIFRKREPGVPPRDHLWETVSVKEIDGHKTAVNSYYDYNPDHILGTLKVQSGMYGSDTLSVVGDLDSAPQRLREALTSITTTATQRGDTFTLRSTQDKEAAQSYVPDEHGHFDGTILATADEFTTVVSGGLEPLTVPKSAAVELRKLLHIRDTAQQLMEMERHTLEDTEETVGTRAKLATLVTAYQSSYGPINRFTASSTGRIDAETGEPIMARRTPAATRILRQDPSAAIVFALELFDEETQVVDVPKMLKERVIAQRVIPDTAKTPQDAIAMSLDRYGTIDSELIAELLGQSPADARASLGTLVYDDPSTESLVHAPEYLSGDVRSKLEAAKEASLRDAKYLVNVEALNEVIPADLGPGDVRARLGAVWISPEIHQQFLRETLNDRHITVKQPLPGEWKVTGNRNSVQATNVWGTHRRDALTLAEKLLEQASFEVTDVVEINGKETRVVNADETEAASEKAENLQEAFENWLWTDSDRTASLLEVYNKRFNCLAIRDYSQDGEYLTLPGMVLSWTPEPHQKAAVARMIAEPCVGLFHQVGAGKTAEMVMGTMELKRMGLVSKPAVIVPNHMLEQFTREWLQLYPQARLLAASAKDIPKEKRRLFTARIAANEWDAVILTQGAFEKIPLSDAAKRAFLETHIAELRESLAASDDPLTVKHIERRIVSEEATLQKAMNTPADQGVSFENTGIDYLVVDELHGYKNLTITSKIRDANIQGSRKASDLHMKLGYLRSRYGDRVMTGATATPLANSVTEAFVMQRYLRPDLLEAAGIRHFDQWAATFGETVSEMEMAPAGEGRFRLKTRFAKFRNVAEMLRLWQAFADVKTAEDLNLPVPLIRARADGQRLPETIVLEPSPELVEYISLLGDRADAVANRSVPPTEDNMLSIATDGRKAALDLRMVGGATTHRTKLDAVADKILAIWSTTKDRTYLGKDQQPDQVTGGLQLVFCEQGIPGTDRWSAYEELKRLLLAGGMPTQSVRFMHDAKNDSEKARMFAAARAGHVAVLIGSTEKMGVGTNVQDRAIALHHVDCPWRPADLEQRDGRIIRRGNQNAEVGIYRYVVEKSFDSYMWQTVERKHKFIDQIMRGTLGTREIEDIGAGTLSALEAKALASGNPLLLEKASADNELARLKRLERGFSRNTTQLRYSIEGAQRAVTELNQNIADLKRAQETMQPVGTGDSFRMDIGGAGYKTHAAAAAAFGDWAHKAGVKYLPNYGKQNYHSIGHIGGFDITARSMPSLAGVDIQLALKGVPGSEFRISREDATNPGVGLIRQLCNRVAAIPQSITTHEQKVADNLTQIEVATAALQKPFEHHAELEEAKQNAARVNKALSDHAQEQQQSPNQDEQNASSHRDAQIDDAIAAAATSYHGTSSSIGRHNTPVVSRALTPAATQTSEAGIGE